MLKKHFPKWKQQYNHTNTHFSLISNSKFHYTFQLIRHKIVIVINFIFLFLFRHACHELQLIDCSFLINTHVCAMKTLTHQILRRTERQLQQAESAPRHHRVRAHKPEEAFSELQQARPPSSLHLTPHSSESSRRAPQLPQVPPTWPREPRQPWNPKREPELPVPGLSPLLHRPPLIPHWTWR